VFSKDLVRSVNFLSPEMSIAHPFGFYIYFALWENNKPAVQILAARWCIGRVVGVGEEGASKVQSCLATCTNHTQRERL
jgi:hypothetical protein